jgi:predicted ATPase
VGQATEGLTALAEALALIDKTGERYYEAELYRLYGELTLAQSGVRSPMSEVKNSPEQLRRVGIAHQSVSIAEAVTVGRAHPTEESEAEACFLKAIEIAQRQQAKSLELRAVMSLARLRQYQAAQFELRITDYALRTRLDEAHSMLSEVYNWFTEGFDTKDLQEAKSLIEELSC